MTMQEIVEELSFKLGFPTSQNLENVSLEGAVLSAFRELKRYIKTPTNKTVPYSPRLDLVALGIKTNKILSVQAAYPRIGTTLSNLDSGNVFQIAAAVNVTNGIANGSTVNIDPIVTELAYSQVRNCLRTDFQWSYDAPNQVVYCTHSNTKPAAVTVRYVPNYQDVSEITSDTWIDYLIRIALANAKIAIGRVRSKYQIEGSNVTLDGETLINEGNTELDTIHEELGTKSSKLIILN